MRACRYAEGAGVKFLTADTSVVRPDFSNPTVKKFFGDKLKDSAYRIQIAKEAHKQLAKNSDVELPVKDLHAALKTTFGV